MRKFKIKNRQKRKYTKRKRELQSSFQRSNTIIISLIPALSIILASGAAFILIYKNPFPLQNISLEFSLPETNITPLIDQTAHTLSALQASITAIFNTLLHFLIFSEKITYSILATTTERITFIIKQTTIIAVNEIISSTDAAIILITTASNMILKLLTTLHKIMLTIILTIKTTIIVLAELLTFSLQWLGDKTIYLSNQLIERIRWPFLKLAKDLEIFSPFINKITNILKNSITKPIANINTLFSYLNFHSV
jgi:hypothetical protein